jgi:Caspase domain
MRVALLIASIVSSVLLAVLPAHSQSRLALVIGNSAYRNAAPLPNTQNDATDIAASLQRLGFSVKTLHNATFDDMRRALLQFGHDARGSDMAVIYFAGHGMEIGGENWLIPVDAELRSDRDAENEATSLKSVMLQVANAARLGLVILDSCRDNPFAAQMQRASRPRAVERGLARVEPTDNVLVAYAAKDGTVASDGRRRNSPFTAALPNNLETPGIEIRFLLAAVRDEVLAVTNGQQQPFVYGSLSRQAIYLNPPAQSERLAGAPPNLPPPLTEAERAWAAVQANPSVAALEAFVRRFGDSFFADLARVRIEELKRTQTAVAPQAQNTVPSPTPPPTPVAPQSASPTGEPCGSRAVVLLDPCLQPQEPPSQQAAIPSPTAGLLPSLHDPRERAERERAERQRIEAEQAEHAKAERDRIAHEQAERERLARLEQARLEEERIRREQADQPKIDAQSAVSGDLVALARPTEIASQPSSPVSGGALVRAMKIELKRVGCYSGPVDDEQLNDVTKAAMRKFSRYAKFALISDEASTDLLEAIHAKPARVCPLSCDAGTEIRGNKCVVIKPSAPLKPTTRPRDETRPSPRQQTADQKAPQPNDASRGLGGGGKSGETIFLGNQRCRLGGPGGGARREHVLCD